MFIYLSKLLPLFVYPLGLALIFLIIAMVAKPGSKWVKYSVITAFIILLIGGNGWFSTILVRSLEWQYLPPEELPEGEMIVVLGGGTGAVQYPRRFVELGDTADRVTYASSLYHQGAAPKILLSGGYIPFLGENDGSPAENMAVIFGLLGVPEDAIIIEKESLNTYENAIFTKEILDSLGIHKIILVTSAQHMPRAMALFTKQGLDVSPAPTDFSVTQADWQQLWELKLQIQIFNLIPSASNLSATTSAMKEYMGIFMYKLRGWI
jgi:uncharacterized SAM-binding protein YcdF (DUF218 family)